MDNCDEKPPSCKANLDSGAGILPADGSLAGRFKGVWGLLAGDWSVCPARSSIHSRCHSVPVDIQGR